MTYWHLNNYGKIFVIAYVNMTTKDNLSSEPIDENLEPQDLESNDTQESVETSESIETSEIDLLQAEKEKYLRLYSEFDNFRRRTTKERLEWMQTASKDVILNVLPVIDDMERALKSMEASKDMSKEAIEGMILIYKKLYSILEKKWVETNGCTGQ